MDDIADCISRDVFLRQKEEITLALMQTYSTQENKKELPSPEANEGAAFSMEIDNLATNQENLRPTLREIDQNRLINSMIKIPEEPIGKEGRWRRKEMRGASQDKRLGDELREYQGVGGIKGHCSK